MSLDVAKLQVLYKTDAVSRAIIDHLKTGAAQVPEVEELADECSNAPVLAKLDARKRELAIIKALKAIHKTGCGTFITGRRGNSSRMRWELEPEEIHALATGGGEAPVEVQVETLPGRGSEGVLRGGGGPARGRAGGGPLATAFPNLDICVDFFASTKSWSEPVLAAARAGLWDDDVPPPEWEQRLDRLEEALDAVRLDERTTTGAPPRASKPGPRPSAFHKRP